MQACNDGQPCSADRVRCLGTRRKREGGLSAGRAQRGQVTEEPIV